MIQIEEWTNTAECDFKYVAAGHHSDADFIAAVRVHEKELGADSLDDDDLTVRRVWLVIDQQTGIATPAQEGDPGAVAYTETGWF